MFWRTNLCRDDYGWKYWNDHLQCWTWITADEEEFVYLYDVRRDLLPEHIQRLQQRTPRWTPTTISWFRYNHRQFEPWAYPPERHR